MVAADPGAAMNARDEVLARIRSAIGDSPAVPVVPRAYRRTGELSETALLELLTERLVDYKATVHRCSPASLATVIQSLVEGRVLVPPAFPVDGATVDAGF